MTWYVSRQLYYADGRYVVEVAGGGLDYANCDMLCTKYKQHGEGREFEDPRAAAEAAIQVASAWRKDERGRRIHVACGHTGGFTMPFESCTTTELRRWAKDLYSNMKKCGTCNGLIKSNRESYKLEFDDETTYCSPHCAEKAQYEYEKANAECE